MKCNLNAKNIQRTCEQEIKYVVSPPGGGIPQTMPNQRSRASEGARSWLESCLALAPLAWMRPLIAESWLINATMLWWMTSLHFPWQCLHLGHSPLRPLSMCVRLFGVDHSRMLNTRSIICLLLFPTKGGNGGDTAITSVLILSKIFKY